MRYFRNGYYCRLGFIIGGAITSIPRDLCWVPRSRFPSSVSGGANDSYSYAGDGGLSFYATRTARVVLLGILDVWSLGLRPQPAAEPSVDILSLVLHQMTYYP